MRRQDKQMESQEEIEEILRTNFTCRVAFTDPQGPYLLPLHYGYHNGNLYFHSARVGKKIDLMRADPRVCVEISDSISIYDGPEACDYGTEFRSLLIQGEAKLDLDREEAKEGLNAIMQQYTGQAKWEYTEKMLLRTLVWKIVPKHISAKQSKQS